MVSQDKILLPKEYVYTTRYQLKSEAFISITPPIRNRFGVLIGGGIRFDCGEFSFMIAVSA